MYSHDNPNRLYVALAAILVIALLWFAWHSATDSAAQAASQTALQATEQVLKFNRQGERTLLTVTTIFGISIVLAALVIPYVAWASSAHYHPAPFTAANGREAGSGSGESALGPHHSSPQPASSNRFES